MRHFIGLLVTLAFVAFITYRTAPEASIEALIIIALLTTIQYNLATIYYQLDRVVKHTEILALTVAMKEIRNNPDLRDKLKKKLFDNSV